MSASNGRVAVFNKGDRVLWRGRRDKNGPLITMRGVVIVEAIGAGRGCMAAGCGVARYVVAEDGNPYQTWTCHPHHLVKEVTG